MNTNFPQEIKRLVITDDVKLNSLNKDFGQIYTATPIASLQAKSVDEISKVLSYCNNNQLAVISRGMSHSASGQCLVKNGVVIDLRSLNQIHELEFDGVSGYALVDAGCTWEKLVKESLKKGATPPTLTDWQKLTIGGTISTSGVGFMSHKNGIQADNVLELEIVTANGQIQICSNEKNKDLFDLVRAGLGHFGVISKVKLPLVKAPSRMHVFKMLIEDTTVFYEKMEAFKNTDKYECIHSFLIPNTENEFTKKLGKNIASKYKNFLQSFLTKHESFSYFVELVQYEYEDESFELLKPSWQHTFYEIENYYSYVTKEPPLIETEKKHGKTAHPELAIFIPSSNLIPFMNKFLEGHSEADMSEGPVLLIPLKNALINAPLCKRPNEDFYFIGILRNAYPNTAERIKYLSNLNRKLYQTALDHGGVRYPVDSLDIPRNINEWQKHYGKEWENIELGKQKYDPSNTFRSLIKFFEE